MEQQILKVFIAKIPDKIEYKQLYPAERWAEITSCVNEKVKKQKYVAWKLLEKVFESEYKTSFENIIFSKTGSGKWLADKMYFSISHSQNYVAVCIDNQPIGLDIELIDEQKMTEKIFSFIATDREKQLYKNLSTEDIATLWTKKEAIFKQLDKSGFIPKNIETYDYFTTTIIENSLKMAISVSFADNKATQTTLKTLKTCI